MQPIDHAMDRKPNYKRPYGQIYTMSEVKLKTLKTYIETNVTNGVIQQSLPVAALTLVATKHDCGLWLCVDYSARN